MRFPLLVAAFVALAAAGCGTPHRSAPATTGATAPTMQLTIFRVRRGTLRAEAVRVPATRSVATAALLALGLPATIETTDGTARIDVEAATPAQAAEIVYTLTQFPGIRRVAIAGRKPLTRAGVSAFVAPILVERPPDGGRVGPSFVISGSASVFEAQFVVELRRHGKLLARRSVMASEGAPGRGAFRTLVHAAPGPLTIRAYAPSAADGRPQHEVVEHVTVEP